MRAPTVLERVMRCVAKTAGLEPGAGLDEETALVGAGLSLSSVAVLELILELEKEFGVELDLHQMREAAALRSIGRLAHFLDSAFAGG